MIFMAGGKVAADGDTRTVLTPETIRAVFGVDARVYPDDYCGALQVVYRKE
jgi:ABC-type cobalamin/Fe3+-siderophores transport system ATPase subunit